MNSSLRPPCEKRVEKGKSKVIKSILLSICKFTQATFKEVYRFVKVSLVFGQASISN
jgi:hypothetical protein